MNRPRIYKAEAFDVMQFYYKRAQDPLVRCLVRLNGRVDEAALKLAVELSAKVVPQIFCRFDTTRRQAAWVCAGYTGEDAVHVVEPEEPISGFEERLLARTSVDIIREPQIKIFIVRGPSADSLCMLMSHLVCDGGGFKDYLYLLCRLYGRCREKRAYDEALKPLPRGLGQLFRNVNLFKTLVILTEKSKPGKRWPRLAVPMQGDEASPFIAKHVIDEEHFAAIRARAKVLGSTVNDMLLAAYLRALSRETGERDLRIPCPVDLRKYLPEGDPRFCNMTGNLYCEAEIGEGERFETTLQKVSACMEKQKRSAECLKGPLKLRILYPILSFAWIGKNFNKLFSIPVTSVTNLGILDANRFSFSGAGITEAYLTAAIKHAPYFQVSVSTFAGRCTLTCNLHGTPEDRARIGTFLKNMDREMAGEETL